MSQPTETIETAGTVETPGPLIQVVDWIRGHERTVLLAGVAFQLVILLGILGSRLSPLVTGQTVWVRVVPVDPRDLMRGDYVILGYEFSRLPRVIDGFDARQGTMRDLQGATVYVVLEDGGDLGGGRREWVPARYTRTKPSRGTFLRGTIRGSRIEYGIESYFVQEGTGRAWEQGIRDRDVLAELSVDSSGKAVLRSLARE